ncbi:MAG: hypothetical protein AAGB35_00500 [Pseudomonadota bacterium]
MLLMSLLTIPNAKADNEQITKESTNDSTQVTEEDDLVDEDNIIDRTHRAIAEGANNAAQRIDGIFAKDFNKRKKNKSHFIVETKQVFEESGDKNLEYRIILRIDLPNTSERLKLFFNSDSADEDNLEEQVLPSQNDYGDSIDDASFGLQWDSNPDKKWKSSAKLGITAGFDPYIKYQIKRKFRLSENWYSIPNQEFWYYQEDKAGEASSIKFIRPISNTLEFYTNSKAQYEERKDFFELIQSLNFTQILSPKSSITYHAGIIGRTKPNFQTTNYYITTNYTRKIYRHWLYLSIYPEIRFPREEDFDEQAAISFILKTVF